MNKHNWLYLIRKLRMLRGIQYWRVIVITAIITVSAVAMASAMRSEPTTSNGIGNGDARPRPETQAIAESQPTLIPTSSNVEAQTILVPTPLNTPADPMAAPQLKSSNQIAAAATPFVVNYLGDADDASPGDGICATATGVCTLRAAIREANALPGTDDINFSVTGTIPFGSGGGTYEINDDLSIQPHTGQARNLTIQSIGARVFKVNAGVTLLLTNMTIANGGSGGATSAKFGGGAIWNDRGRVFVYNVTFSANYSCSPVPVCGSGSGHGGAIANGGYLVVYNSTFVNNVSPEHGGAIFNFGGEDDAGIAYNGEAIIVNSTFFGNRALSLRGGAIANRDAYLTVVNSTIAGNQSGFTGGGIDNTVAGEVTISNTILAYNTADSPATANCRIALYFFDYGGNLDSGASCGFTAPTSQSNTDPNLGPLRDNGGRTDTMALQSGSPAIDAGVPLEGDCMAPPDGPLTYDQRYFPRPVDGNGDGIKTCDSGAYEAGLVLTTSALTPVTVGDNIHDTATIKGLINPDGTGSITFKLYSDAACATEVFSDVVSPIPADGDYVSGDYATTAAVSYYWIASFSGDSNNDPIENACGNAGETSVVNKASPNIITTPNPTIGVIGVTLNDSADLSGGFNPTGDITFNLYAPSDPTCSGAPAFTNVVTVNGNGVYTTSSGFASNAIDIWHWAAAYSGDSNNNPASSACADEPVTIYPPAVTVTGGGQISVPDPTSKRSATFGFNAHQIEVGSTAATGHFNYVNHDTGLHINGSVDYIKVIEMNPDGTVKTVQFSGACEGNGPACTFIVIVEDHGEPGTDDEFGITVTGDLTETQSQRVINEGNIQFHIR